MALDPNVALMCGIPTNVLSAATAAGTAFSRNFSIVRNPANGTTVHCQVTGTFTVLNGNLEVSLNGGTTWSTFLAFDFNASPIFVFDAAAGAIYRFNISNITQSVTPNVLATLA